jgi:hypothetical protein
MVHAASAAKTPPVRVAASLGAARVVLGVAGVAAVEALLLAATFDASPQTAGSNSGICFTLLSETYMQIHGDVRLQTPATLVARAVPTKRQPC